MGKIQVPPLATMKNDHHEETRTGVTHLFVDPSQHDLQLHQDIVGNRDVAFLMQTL